MPCPICNKSAGYKLSTSSLTTEYLPANCYFVHLPLFHQNKGEAEIAEFWIGRWEARYEKGADSER